MGQIRLIPPVKALWRDSYKIQVSSIATFSRFLAQPFGVNWAPLPYSQITGDIGHPGIDIALPVGERVFASHDGVVIERDDIDDRDGLGISLFSIAQKIVTIYWHLSKNLVNLNDQIKAGQLLGLSGGTGKSYGPHLHFGLYQTDDKGIILNAKNGFHGAIDPMPFFYLPEKNPTIMTKQFVEDAYILFFGRLPDSEEALFWEGKNYRAMFQAMLDGRATEFKKFIGE